MVGSLFFTLYDLAIDFVIQINKGKRKVKKQIERFAITNTVVHIMFEIDFKIIKITFVIFKNRFEIYS